MAVRVASAELRESLRRFLRERGCQTEQEGELGVVVVDCGRSSPPVATLVALVEEWRCAAHAAEATLDLDGRVTILRTET